ncbi:MAG: metal-dependent hydrolase, partial [Pseudomonadota bacterium]
AFRLDIAYADQFGHRGASHSLMFALSLALMAVILTKALKSSWLITFLFIGTCAASHGVLDSFTNGGLGSALWWPFSDQRVFSPWQVIEVSPLRLSQVFSVRAWQVLQSELIWVWCPAALLCFVLFAGRHRYYARLTRDNALD